MEEFCGELIRQRVVCRSLRAERLLCQDTRIAASSVNVNFKLFPAPPTRAVAALLSDRGLSRQIAFVFLRVGFYFQQSVLNHIRCRDVAAVNLL